jgi:hypothetical protein
MKIETSSIITENHDEIITDFLNQYNQERAVSFEDEINEDVEIVIYDGEKIVGGIIGRSLWGNLRNKTSGCPSGLQTQRHRIKTYICSRNRS